MWSKNQYKNAKYVSSHKLNKELDIWKAEAEWEEGVVWNREKHLTKKKNPTSWYIDGLDRDGMVKEWILLLPSLSTISCQTKNRETDKKAASVFELKPLTCKILALVQLWFVDFRSSPAASYLTPAAQTKFIYAVPLIIKIVMIAW